MKTVFITGASSGIGKETAKIFQQKGWQVIASMRHPDQEKELTRLAQVQVVRCDVTDSDSIKKAIREGMQAFGRIDVLINNAGYYTLGPFEEATKQQITRQIDTNLTGLMETTKEILPYFREQMEGTIINVSSIAGVTAYPMQSLYHATKWGVEGFSESLQYELRQFNIRIKLIEPGVIKTDFYGRSMSRIAEAGTMYDAYANKTIDYIMGNAKKASSAVDVAQTIYKAATDQKKKLRYPTGKSKNLVTLRRLLPFPLFRKLVQISME